MKTKRSGKPTKRQLEDRKSLHVTRVSLTDEQKRRIREARSDGVAQKTLADAYDVAVDVIRKIEKGKP